MATKIGINLFWFFVIFLMLLITPAYSGEMTSTRDIDLIDISAYLKHGNVLKVSLLYQNREEDQSVHWENGKVNCICEVYENDGSVLDWKKGRTIGRKDKTLKRYSQNFYIDLPQTDKKWGIIECECDTGYRTLTASEDFSLD